MNCQRGCLEKSVDSPKRRQTAREVKMIYYLSGKQQQQHTNSAGQLHKSKLLCCMLHGQLGQLNATSLGCMQHASCHLYAIRVADPLVKILANRYFSHPNWLPQRESQTRKLATIVKRTRPSGKCQTM